MMLHLGIRGALGFQAINNLADEALPIGQGVPRRKGSSVSRQLLDERLFLGVDHNRRTERDTIAGCYEFRSLLRSPFRSNFTNYGASPI
jgi:hypothetical protein